MDFNPYLTVNGISHHNNTPEFQGAQWNENNPGYGLMFKAQNGNTTYGLGVGQYLNSMNRNSNYIAGTAQRRLLGGDNLNLDLGLRGGLVTGYNANIAPILQPTATLGLGKNLDINLGYQYPVKNVTPEVWSLNLDYKL